MTDKLPMTNLAEGAKKNMPDITPELIGGIINKRIKHLRDEVYGLLKEERSKRLGISASNFEWQVNRIDRLGKNYENLSARLEKMENGMEQVEFNKAAIWSLRELVFHWRRKAALEKLPAFVDALANELEAKIKELENGK